MIVLKSYLTVVREGDERGNGMLFRLRLPSGLTVHGLPTPNEYGGEWDLGPTWNYLVEADQLFLVDAGRWGTGGTLVEMLAQVGRSARDLDFVILSHGHEDHDGGLNEVVAASGAAVKAHAIYARLARKHPDLAPAEYKRAFPAKCWHCFMPESYYGPNCLEYHGYCDRQAVEAVGDGRQPLLPGLETLHIPGHSPDALAIWAADELLIPGDTLLPGITPWPSSLRMHAAVAGVLGPEYAEPGRIYGLARYLASIKTLKNLANGHSPAVLPAHRLFHAGQLNELDLAQRVEEMIQHHLDRCADILRILQEGPADAEAIARGHFAPEKLKGPGLMMGKNEIVCHCELLQAAGCLVQEGRLYQATGAGDLEGFIAAI